METELVPLALRESFCLLKPSQQKVSVQSFLPLLPTPAICYCSRDGFSRSNPGICWCERAECCSVFCLSLSRHACTVQFVSLTFCALYKLWMSQSQRFMGIIPVTPMGFDSSLQHPWLKQMVCLQESRQPHGCGVWLNDVVDTDLHQLLVKQYFTRVQSLSWELLYWVQSCRPFIPSFHPWQWGL